MERGSSKYYYNYDGLGSVTELTIPSGALVESYTYDAYGQPTIFNSTFNPQHSSLVGNRYMFTGREWDAESGLYHYRARAYYPIVGRFLQRDPIGYEDSMNLYGYVKNNSINFIDPTGEAWWIPIIEGALLAVDTYGLIKTETDPCASQLEKNVVRAAWVAGALSFGGGYALAARAAKIDKLIDAGKAIDKADKSGQLTKAGRALEKHGSRKNSVFPKALGNVVSKNELGQQVLESIIKNPKSISKPNKFGGLDIIAPDGKGVSFYKDFTFRGFLEP